MKPFLFALTTLALGSAIGWIATRSEFAREKLPIEPVSVRGSADSGGTASVIGPRAVVVGGSRYNFGTIDRYASDSHEFEIRNDGDAPLTLTVGKTTCKCTNFSAAKGSLAPGETTKVKLEWTVKTGDPLFEQSAELITNDPTANPLQLTIHGNVVDTVRPDRPQLSLGDVSANEPQTVRMRIHTYRDRQLAIEKHEWLRSEGVDHFEVSYAALSPEEVAQESGAFHGVEVTLTILPGLPLGPLAQTLKLSTNLVGHEAIEIPVVGNMVSDVSIVGSGVIADRLLINLGTLAQGAEHTKTVYLMVKGPYREETGLQIESLEPAQEFEATLGEPIRTNPKIVRYPLSIVIPAGITPVVRTSDETYARLKLAITHPQVKEMTVRLRYIVK
jgi:hypothetical protein